MFIKNTFFEPSLHNILLILLIQIQICQIISLNKEPKLIGINQLASSSQYFFTIDTGLCLCNKDFSNITNLYKFNAEQQNNLKANNNINYYFYKCKIKNIEYYFCLLGNILYVYNTETKNMYHYKLNSEENIKTIGIKYNNSELFLYLIRDNILYLNIISLSSEKNMKFYINLMILL